MQYLKQYLVSIACLSLCGPLPVRAEEDSSLLAEQYARQVVFLTNTVRATKSLPPLKFNAKLSTAATWLAGDMAEKNYFSHEDKQGRNIESRLPAYGYKRYHAIGENIAAGQPSPDKALEEWMKSEEHCKNILSREWNEIGVGYAFSPDSKFQSYWVQDFGCRFNAYPLVINNEEPATTTAQVHLYIYGDGWAKEMRLSNDGKTWTDWRPYTANCEWTLAEGGGERTVYTELRSGDTVCRDQDTIKLLAQTAGK